MSLSLQFAASAQAPPRPTPPPVPDVKPIVSVPAEIDRNSNRVDDAIDDRLTSALEVMRTRSGSPQQLEHAEAVLEERVTVEFVFSEQITQQQIDDFVAAGGEFGKIFEAISYGWTGTIPAGKAEDVAASMGKRLLGIVETKPIEMHLDEATRTGRVRPLWPVGLTGDGSGADRVTVAILDSGVDGSHTDLTGRMEYWKDWTSDNHLTAQDAGHHGSHVAGIAVGSGAAYLASPGQLKYTDHGNMPDSNGSFFPSPIHIPLSVSSVTWNSNLRWQTGVGTTQINYGHLAKVGGSWGGINVLAAASSPVSVSSGPFGNPISGSNTYSGYVTRSAGSGTPAYAFSHTVSYGNAAGDAFSPLSGVSPASRWAGFKVFTDAGAGNSGDIYEALDDLVANRQLYNMKVANMSLGIVGSGGPGIDTTLRNKTNTAAANGIVVVVSAGNSGFDAGPGGEVGDPGRAEHTITIVSTSDANALTNYSSHGFASPGDANTGDEDMKPDLAAPGGSVSHHSNILAVDSNTGDEGPFTDGVANDYYNIQGTSMASPFAAGCAALLIDAMQRSGETWDFSGGGALTDALRVKNVLLMTATETNLARESGGSSGSPTLQRGGKDINEGYGIVNADAAVEAYLNPPLASGVMTGDTFGPEPTGRRCWARRIVLDPSKLINLQLDPGAADYDIYIYSSTPDSNGNPQILTASTVSGSTDEILVYTPTVAETGYLVVKRVSGSGSWTLSGSVPVSMSMFSLE